MRWPPRRLVSLLNGSFLRPLSVPVRLPFVAWPHDVHLNTPHSLGGAGCHLPRFLASFLSFAFFVLPPVERRPDQLTLWLTNNEPTLISYKVVATLFSSIMFSPYPRDFYLSKIQSVCPKVTIFRFLREVERIITKNKSASDSRRKFSETNTNTVWPWWSGLWAAIHLQAVYALVRKIMALNLHCGSSFFGCFT